MSNFENTIEEEMENTKFMLKVAEDMKMLIRKVKELDARVTELEDEKL